MVMDYELAARISASENGHGVVMPFDDFIAATEAGASTADVCSYRILV